MNGSGRRDPVDVKRPSDVEGPIADGEPGQIGPVTNRPTVSVIITNHNYGHFLEASLDSVFGQSHRAGEIIVVDDHSTDLSARVLSRHRGAINVLQASARGQAAAFNLGFRHATCEVVAFLDADDMLNPDALETALDYWSEDLAVLSFGLGTIDASGRSTGLHPYSLAADDGDNRPRLIRSRSVSGPFLFAPTSGNLFSRAFLQAALPMPEVEWRICADAYVVRAAAIWGRSRAIARALGQYRVHGANNYTRPDTFDPWAMQRSLRDVENSARALEALADWDGAPETGSDRDALRVALRLRALETRANAAAWTGDRAAFRAHVATAVKATLSAPALPFAERMAAAGAMFRFARRAPLKRPVDPSLEEAKVYPLPLPRLPGAAALTRRLRNLERPRWCQPLRFGVTHDFTDHGPHRNALAEGWCGRRWDGACESFGAEAALEFTLEPADHQVTVELVLAAPPGWERDDLGVSITASGERAWVGALPSDGTETMIRFTLARDPFAPHDPQRVEIGCHRLVPRRRLSLSRSRAPYFRLVSLRLEEAADRVPEGVLRPRVPVAMADLVRSGPDSGWLTDANGSARLSDRTARLSFAFEPGARRFDLDLVLCDDVPDGWLQVRAGDADLFTGQPCGGAALRMSLPEIPGHLGGRAIDLDIGFSPAESDSDSVEEDFRLGFSQATLIDRGDERTRRGVELFGRPFPTLNAGQTVFLASNANAAAYLVAGWDGPDEGGARNLAGEATLGFTLPVGLVDPILRLTLRPLFAKRDGFRHVVGISADGELLQAVDLQDEGQIDIPLGPVAAERRVVELTLHSAHVALAPEVDPQGAPVFALLELVSFSMRGNPTHMRAFASDRTRQPSETDLFGLVELAYRATADLKQAELDDLLSLRSSLAVALCETDDRALESLAARPVALAAIENLGGALLAAPLDPVDAEIAAAATSAESGDRQQERLRGLMLSFLLLPAFRSDSTKDLATAPALLLRDPAALANYIGREPEFRDECDAAAYVAWLERILGELDRLLRHEPVGFALHDFAVETLRRLRNTKSLFTDQNLVKQIRLRSRCIETVLRQEGCLLSMPPRSLRAPGRLRLAVLVRSLQPSPEAWAVLGMYGRIDRTRFETILITANASEKPLAIGDRFDRELSLAGFAPGEAVAAIRALDLDAFVLGAHVANWEQVTSIVAHRLARTQIVSCFNSPATLGHESFDIAIGWKGSSSEQTRHQYTERLVEIAEPLQCCFDFTDVPRPPPRSVAALRAEFGLPKRGALLVSGAMAHKIQPALMEAWAQTLARAKGAKLVLCPFTQWWAMDYAPKLFRARLDRCLDAAGVARGRVIVQERLEPSDYRRLLAACDVYLDSFPYAGGTTVCEALDSGLPVVSRRGDMLRGRTGAAWAEEFGLDELVAADAEQYVEIAAALASDAKLRGRIAARISTVLSSGPPPYSDSTRFGAAFSDAIARICAEAGIVGESEQVAPAARSLGGGQPPAVTVGNPLRATTRRHRVVILGHGRTGSTLLCNMLAGVGDSIVDFELFHRTEIQYRSGKVLDAEAISERDADPVAWLERYHRDCRRRGYGLTGFKIFAHHDARVIEHVVADVETRLVILGRRNLLAQYSSQRIAEQTGEWAAPKGRKPKQATIPFDPTDFEKFEKTVGMLDARLDQILGERRTEALVLDYSDLATSGTSERLSEHLEHEVPQDSEYALNKQNPSRVIDRFSYPAIVLAYLERRGLGAWANYG